MCVQPDLGGQIPASVHCVGESPRSLIYRNYYPQRKTFSTGIRVTKVKKMEIYSCTAAYTLRHCEKCES